MSTKVRRGSRSMREELRLVAHLLDLAVVVVGGAAARDLVLGQPLVAAAAAVEGLEQPLVGKVQAEVRRQVVGAPAAKGERAGAAPGQAKRRPS